MQPAQSLLQMGWLLSIVDEAAGVLIQTLHDVDEFWSISFHRLSLCPHSRRPSLMNVVYGGDCHLMGCTVMTHRVAMWSVHYLSKRNAAAGLIACPRPASVSGDSLHT